MFTINWLFVLVNYINVFGWRGWTQWRRLHRAQGHVPTPTFTNVRTEGHREYKKSQQKTTKLYWPSRKHSPKRLLIILLGPKSGGARPKKKLFPALCAGPVPPHFQIRSGATGRAPSRTYLPLTLWKHPQGHNPDICSSPQSWKQIGTLEWNLRTRNYTSIRWVCE